MKYPECEKMAKIKDQSQMIGEFIEWLDRNKMFVTNAVKKHVLTTLKNQSLNQALSLWYQTTLKRKA